MMRYLFFLLWLPTLCLAQNSKLQPAQGGEYQFNPDGIACLTDEERSLIQFRLQENINQLAAEGLLSQNEKSQGEPRFIWPVQKSSNAGFNDVWAISNYVDHNPNGPNQLEDYNCGTRTYDTSSGYDHRGIDMYLWPFTWYQFQNNLAEVIAAAPGVIIQKYDGEFDMNCAFSSKPWNAIYVRHDDGSIAWYGHLKSGPLTNKIVGQSVSEGEFLGIIGSSGNSTGPHLHFEVYDQAGNLVDPYSGPCNTGNSWWKDQPDYYEPNINALGIHNAPPDFKFNECNDLEDTNFQDEFLPNKRIYMALYLKDQLSGTTANFKLKRPNGTTRLSWDLALNNTYSSSYWYYYFEDLTDLGTWTFECTYEGQTLSTTFKVSSTLGVEDQLLEEISIGPNPVVEMLHIRGNYITEQFTIQVFNQLGQKMYDQNLIAREIDLKFLNKGVYFLKVIDRKNKGNRTFALLK